jgi:hypothetical protein
MMVYTESGEEDTLALAYAMTYLISAFEVLSTIEGDCANWKDDFNDWLNQLTGSFNPE